MAQWLISLLKPHCTSIISCDPRENKLVSRNARKCDEVDAQSLCRLLRLGELQKIYHTDDQDRFAYKAAVQYYLDLQRDRVRAKNKIKAIYKRLGMVPTGERVYSKRSRAEYLKEVTNPIWTSTLERAYNRYDLAHDGARQAIREIEELAKGYREVAQFKRIPGVGPVGANLFSAYIMTPHRFATKSRLHRYCRLSITDRSSDNKPLGYQRLERHGSVELKSMSYHTWLAAVSAKRANEVKDYYEAALEFNGGMNRKARLSTQRKVLTVMWTIWKNGYEYDPELFITSPMS